MVGNMESASYASGWTPEASNLTLTASIFFKQIQTSCQVCGQWWATVLRSDQEHCPQPLSPPPSHHGQMCRGPARFHNYESYELRRGWRKCHCPIYICGTLGGQFKRRNSKRTKWEDAKAVAAVLETADSWSGKPVIHASVSPPEEQQAASRLPTRLRSFCPRARERRLPKQHCAHTARSCGSWSNSPIPATMSCSTSLSLWMSMRSIAA